MNPNMRKLLDLLSSFELIIYLWCHLFPLMNFTLHVSFLSNFCESHSSNYIYGCFTYNLEALYSPNLFIGIK